MTTTCQICGRAIKANTGVIAHHGYQRPGQGWQTASCFGARFRPYEVACDALPLAIESATRYRDLRQAAYDKLMGDPPATLSYQPRRHGYPSGEPEVYTRPENYNVNERGSWRPRTYDGEFKSTRDTIERDIKMTTESIACMTKRLADWRPIDIANCA